MSFADSFVPITPGVGANMATLAVGGKQIAVVAVAGPSGHLRDSIPTYYVWTGPVAFAANKQHLSIMNEVGSGVLVKVRKLFAVNLQTVAVTGVAAQFDFKRISAHAPGAAITPAPADTANAALPVQIEASSGGTVTEGITLWSQVFGSDEVTAANTAAANLIMAQMNLMPENETLQELVLREGEGMTVKQITSTTVGSFGWLAVMSVV